MDDKKTMTAEEVEQAKFKVRAIFKDIESEYPETLVALSRLAAQAARVPGLEEQLPEGMKHCTIVFRECSIGHGWLTATNWTDHGCPTCAKRTTESERDAARKEAARLAGEKAESVLGASEQRARAERAESDLQAERTTTAGLREHIAELRLSGDTLRERVATLFAESEKWKEVARATNDLHNTAEARVRELEATLKAGQGVGVHVKVAPGKTEHKSTAYIRSHWAGLPPYDDVAALCDAVDALQALASLMTKWSGCARRCRTTPPPAAPSPRRTCSG